MSFLVPRRPPDDKDFTIGLALLLLTWTCTAMLLLVFAT